MGKLDLYGNHIEHLDKIIFWDCIFKPKLKKECKNIVNTIYYNKYQNYLLEAFNPTRREEEKPVSLLEKKGLIEYNKILRGYVFTDKAKEKLILPPLEIL